jgi:hypothetical protein
MKYNHLLSINIAKQFSFQLLFFFILIASSMCILLDGVAFPLIL